jgi:hypothetical protein
MCAVVSDKYCYAVNNCFFCDSNIVVTPGIIFINLICEISTFSRIVEIKVEGGVVLLGIDIISNFLTVLY